MGGRWLAVCTGDKSYGRVRLILISGRLSSMISVTFEQKSAYIGTLYTQLWLGTMIALDLLHLLGQLPLLSPHDILRLALAPSFVPLLSSASLE